MARYMKVNGSTACATDKAHNFGLMALVTMESGATTKLMDMASWYMLMEMCMKEIG